MNDLQKYLSKSLLATAALLVGASPVWAQTAPSLDSAATFAVLGASTVTNTGTTIVTGDLGVSPGTAITGFPPGIVNGTIYTGPHSAAARAQSDATLAYAALVAAPCTTNLSSQDLGGMSLPPGVYCFNSSAQLTGTLNLDGGGPWIFQIGSTLTTASNSFVLVNGQPSCNGVDVFWQVGSSATLGTGTQFVGNILAAASITLTTGANVSGSALALGAAVTLDTNNVSVCTGPRGGKSQSKCNQGVGNGPEACDPGNSNQSNRYPNTANPFLRSNDEPSLTTPGGVPGNPGRKGGNK